MMIIVLKVAISTIASAIIFLALNAWIGYERSELLAFALLVGISVAALKSSS